MPSGPNIMCLWEVCQALSRPFLIKTRKLETLITLDEPIFKNSGREKTSLAFFGLGLQVEFLEFLGDNFVLILCFLVVPGHYGTPALARCIF